jgi:hypothetical protein
MEKIEGIKLADEIKKVEEDRLQFKREEVQKKIHTILNDIEVQLNSIKKYEEKIKKAEEFKKEKQDLLDRVKKEEWDALTPKKEENKYSTDTISWTVTSPFLQWH